MIPSNIYILLYLINLFIVIVLIFCEKKQPSSVLLWSLILLLIPILGLILYLFLGKGPNLGTKKKFLYKYKEDIKYQKLLGDQKNYLDKSDYSDDIKDIMTFNLQSGSLISTDNEIELFTEVDKMYEDMLEEIENATNSVFAEYYRIRDDEAGRNLVNMLAKKAFEGLSVRLVYDDVGCINLRSDFFDCIIKSGGEVFSFYPSMFKLVTRNLNYRNHRKMLVIDGICAYMGSSNIGDEYLSKNKVISPWTDCNIKVKGTAAMHLNLRFIHDFSFAAKQRETIKLSKHNVTNFLPVQVLSDGPDTLEGSIEQAYIKAIYGARKRVYIQTPYLIPDQAFILALSTVAKSGVDVKIMIPELPDKRYVYYATLSYAAELFKQGVKVYRRKGFLHSKTLIVDDDVCSIGSFNMDIRSFFLQFELTAFVYDKDFNNKLLQVFNNDLTQCKQIDKNYLSQRSLKQKMLERVMRLLSPIM